MLFTIQDTPQDSTKYSPLELVEGHHPRGLLQALTEDWEQDAGHTREPAAYQQDFQQMVWVAQDLAKSNIQEAQTYQKGRYNSHAKEREFEPGQKVLVFLPTSTSKLLTQ